MERDTYRGVLSDTIAIPCRSARAITSGSSTTIGLWTIETMAAAGASVLAIEAGKTIVVDEPEVIALADRHGMAIVSLKTPR
jgi:hypothetical protein